MLTLLGESALRALLLGAMGIIAAWTVRGRGAESRHAIWRIVLAGMLALPALMKVLPPAPILPARPVMTIASSAVSATQRFPSTGVQSSSDHVPMKVSFGAPRPSPPEISRMNWFVLVLAVYGAIAALLLSRVMLAVRRAQKTARSARVVLEFAQLASARQLLGATSMARGSKVGRRINGILEGRAGSSGAMGSLARGLMLVFAVPAVFAAASFQLAAPAQEAQLAKSPLSRYSSMPRVDAARAVLADGWTLTATEAAKLESELERDPENLSARIRLLSYYTQHIISPELRSKHLLWLIEHHPDSDVFQLRTVATGVLPDYSGAEPPEVERARALWRRQAERYATNTRVLANAAGALGGPVALELVRRARSVEPDNAEWVDWLGQVYALAVRTSIAGGMPRSHAGSGVPLHYAFSLPLADSEVLKREIETTPDAGLVRATASELIRETALLTGPLSRDAEVQASEAFGRQLLLRVQQLTAKP